MLQLLLQCLCFELLLNTICAVTANHHGFVPTVGVGHLNHNIPLGHLTVSSCASPWHRLFSARICAKKNRRKTGDDYESQMLAEMQEEMQKLRKESGQKKKKKKEKSGQIEWQEEPTGLISRQPANWEETAKLWTTLSRNAQAAGAEAAAARSAARQNKNLTRAQKQMGRKVTKWSLDVLGTAEEAAMLATTTADFAEMLGSEELAAWTKVADAWDEAADLINKTVEEGWTDAPAAAIAFAAEQMIPVAESETEVTAWKGVIQAWSEAAEFMRKEMGTLQSFMLSAQPFPMKNKFNSIPAGTWIPWLGSTVAIFAMLRSRYGYSKTCHKPLLITHINWTSDSGKLTSSNGSVEHSEILSVL
eukprot:gnl/MRDRNA2_/MRDRNA2_114100_c0_seq1.p1 gnl/MRDRNA2_/MRDRNA2_114100_c0~~gnl/MRDRNA2_/MRDRNA2_114100_c0_seq1.p1  ORF type:complete len:361 (-),score=82.56 gnl/MRDRNA2_/MRDRNA2_114100_c0_seq1:170-1252(-)